MELFKGILHLYFTCKEKISLLSKGHFTIKLEIIEISP